MRRIHFSARLVLVILCVATHASAATITVTTTADDLATNNTCSLREAVLAANHDVTVDKCAAGNGADTIKLGAGTFRLTQPTTNEDQSLNGDLDVAGLLTIQGTGANSTTIDANGAEAAITVLSSAGLTLQKLTVRGARNVNGIPGSTGYGIRVIGGGLGIEDSDVRDNRSTAQSCGCVEDYFCGCTTVGGSGIYGYGTFVIRRSRIYDNVGSGGFSAFPGSVITMDHVEVMRNHAYSGGGLYIHTPDSATITHCDIHDNVADQGVGTTLSAWGAGAYIWADGPVTIEDTKIRDNTAQVPGHSADRAGGLYLTGHDLPVVIRRSEITGNTASQQGGGILLSNGDLVLEDSLVQANQARWSGALDASGGDVTIRRSTIAGNEAEQTGGLHIRGSASYGAVDVSNTTISGNASTVYGGGLDLQGARGTLRNVTFIDNPFTPYPDPHPADPGAVTISNSIFVGACPQMTEYTVFTSGGGNLESPGSVCGFSAPSDLLNVADPRLGPLAANGGYTPTHALLTGSPAVDSGLAAACEAKDQRGLSRPADGNHDGTATCDRGAYELTCTGADGDGDGVADVCDNCPAVANADQGDWNGNGTGDLCDTLGCSGTVGRRGARHASSLPLVIVAFILWVRRGWMPKTQ